MSYYNNDQQEKQEFELEAARLFQQAGGLSSDYRLSLGSNPPDILAQNGKKKIGIEIRRIYADEGKGGSPKYRQRSLCQKIIDKSAELHQKRSNQPYVVDVQFNLQSIFYDKRVNEIAQYLVDQVSIIQIQVGEIVEISSEELWVTGWPEEIYSVSILLREGDGPPFWGLSGANWTGETNFDLIQYGLNKKEDRYRTSCEKVNEAWLLLVLDGQAESSLLDFHADLKGETYISSFDRTFVLGSYGKNLTELKVAPLAKKIK